MRKQSERFPQISQPFLAAHKKSNYSLYTEPKSLPKFQIKTRKSQRTKTYDIEKAQAPDSLQLFQEQLHTAVKAKLSKSRKAYNKTEKSVPYIESIHQNTLLNRQQSIGSQNVRTEPDLGIINSKLDHLLSQIRLQKLQRTTNKSQHYFTDHKPLLRSIYQPQQQQPQPQQPTQIQPMQIQPQIIYPPQQSPQPVILPYPMYSQSCCARPLTRTRRRRKSSDSIQSGTYYPKKQSKTLRENYNKQSTLSSLRKKPVSRLKKAFLTVIFPIFLKSEAKRLCSARKKKLSTFFNSKFEIQLNNIKNWFLNSFKLSLSIVLEKSRLNFQFFHQKSQKVKHQKQKFILEILNIGVSDLLASTTQQKLLYNLCYRGSHALGRFWSAYQIEQLSISEYYGTIRADQNLEKYLLGVFLFIKIFIFNMLLQPHKFDSKSFPKNAEPLTTNMRVLSFVFYRMMKDIVEEYLNEDRDNQYYSPGNWLAVSKQFMVQCSEPLTVGSADSEQGEYISGLYPSEYAESVKENKLWDECITKIKKIIDLLAKQLHLKAKLERKSLQQMRQLT